MDHTVTSNPPKIETVKEHFEAWRSGRNSRREPIPQHLWQAAAGLCQENSISHVCQQLHLSYTDLKKRIHKEHLSPVQFMEIDIDTIDSGWQIECKRPDGSRLRMTGSGQPPAIETIVRSFLS